MLGTGADDGSPGDVVTPGGDTGALLELPITAEDAQEVGTVPVVLGRVWAGVFVLGSADGAAVDAAGLAVVGVSPAGSVAGAAAVAALGGAGVDAIGNSVLVVLKDAGVAEMGTSVLVALGGTGVDEMGTSVLVVWPKAIPKRRKNN